MGEPASDEELMLRYCAGAAEAFEQLYARHKGPVYRYLLRQCGVVALAEELFQDVWLNVIRARERYEVRSRFTTWLYRIAHNRLVDHYRRQAAGVPVSYDDDPDEPLIEQVADREAHEPDNEFERRRQAQQLLGLLAELPEAQREAFLLRTESGLSIEEIAHVMDVNVETAKSRLRYALARLRRGMGADRP